MLKQRIDAVTKANQKFYDAFETLDIAKMDEIWAHQEYVTCIHPGWTIRSGWPAVREHNRSLALAARCLLATTLGAHRPTVSFALGALSKAGLISERRGVIVLRDRHGLSRTSCECYLLLRAEQRRLLGY